MFLHSKEGCISTISIGLQKIESVHNKGQNTIVTNWRSNQQTQELLEANHTCYVIHNGSIKDKIEG